MEIVLSLIIVQHQLRDMFHNGAAQLGFFFFFAADELISWETCDGDTSVTVASISAVLCLRSIFLSPIPSQHSRAVAGQVGDAQSDLEMMGLDERCSMCFDRDFTFSLVQRYMSNILGSQPRDFPSFLWDSAGNEY